MCEVIRLVGTDCEKVKIWESFEGVFPLTGKNDDFVTTETVKNVEKDSLDIKVCTIVYIPRYDNASALAGIHTGVQANTQDIFYLCLLLITL